MRETRTMCGKRVQRRDIAFVVHPTVLLCALVHGCNIVQLPGYLPAAVLLCV
jgi:hypothetical protein